jgi:cytochrome c-type biogenesis protein CcmE
MSTITVNAKHKQRIAWIMLLLLGVGAAVALGLMAFNANLQLFFMPSQIHAGEAPKGQVIRIGGLVENGSVQRATDSLKIRFNVTDNKKNIVVKYEGILPDLFREGQGIVAIGKLQEDGSFTATEVLAKHDENYMPPHVADGLKETADKK